MAIEELLGRPDVDLVPCLHESDCMVDLLRGNTCLYGHVVGMQVHVTSLDALDAEGSQSCEIIG